jgi:V8-like Glu-specific endopeptidase
MRLHLACTLSGNVGLLTRGHVLQSNGLQWLSYPLVTHHSINLDGLPPYLVLEAQRYVTSAVITKLDDTGSLIAARELDGLPVHAMSVAAEKASRRTRTRHAGIAIDSSSTFSFRVMGAC